MPNSDYDFRQRCTLLGISPETDFRGVVRIESLKKLREILHDEAHSGALISHMFDGIPGPKNDLTLELSRLISEYVYGDGVLSDEQMAAIKTAEPLDANVISIPEKTIDGPWNLNDETPTGAVIVSVGKLTIKDGGYVEISNRALDFTVDELIRDGTTRPAGKGEFNIMGTDGQEGQVGDQPDPPGQAKSGAPGNCSSAGISGSSGGDGSPGDPGSQGGEGKPGEDGAPSLQAIIRVTKSVTAAGGILTVTRSGAGGKGGQGGQGATGGAGGNGGNGATCGCTGSSGGSGNTGGTGGKGGTGGPGGQGVNAEGQITVIAPAADLDKFDDNPLPAPPGGGGDPGLRGEGGAGGSGGSGGKHNDGGNSAGKGSDGDPGDRGSPGTATGKAALVAYQPL